MIQEAHGAPWLCHKSPAIMENRINRKKSDATHGIAWPAVQTVLLTRRGGPRPCPHPNLSQQPEKIPISRQDQSVWG